MDAPSIQPAVDPQHFQAAIRQAWDQVAAGWNAQTPQLHAWLAQATEQMLDQAGVRQGARVLDIAAGAGDQTLALARRVGPQGSVLATDLSPVILQLAWDNARAAGLDNVQIKVADAEDLGLEGAAFDAAICRLGLMFCLDAVKALREVRGALKPGARFSALVFAEPQANPCLGIVISTALQHAGRPPQDPFQPGSLFGLGRPGLLKRMAEEAGFREVGTQTVPAVFSLPSTRDYLDFLRSAAPPIRQLMGTLSPDARAAAWADLERKLDVFQTGTGWHGPNELLLVTGTR